MSHDPSASTPAFQRIKEDILMRIRSGEWQEGEMIPGETTLAQTFGVSRMTVNRALREPRVRAVEGAPPHGHHRGEEGVVEEGVDEVAAHHARRPCDACDASVHKPGGSHECD
jgi:DNA-binding transcriptional MocR family regulator